MENISYRSPKKRHDIKCVSSFLSGARTGTALFKHRRAISQEDHHPTLSKVANGRPEQTDIHSDPVDHRHLISSPLTSATGMCTARRHPYCTLRISS